MNPILLTRPNDELVVVNAEKITKIFKLKNSKLTTILFDGENKQLVKESLNTILILINKLPSEQK